MTARHVIWQDLGGPGTEHLRLDRDGEGYLADGLYVGCNDETGPCRLRYKIRLDSQWRMRSLVLRSVDGPEGEDELALKVDENCNWRNGAGEPVAALHGCHEVDIFATPFTKSLPIRRLDLTAGESAEISVAFVGAPGLAAQPVRQRYTCLRPLGPDSGLYRYEPLFHAASAVEIVVDSDGLVIDYPGGFKRAWAG